MTDQTGISSPRWRQQLLLLDLRGQLGRGSPRLHRCPSRGSSRSLLERPRVTFSGVTS